MTDADDPSIELGGARGMSTTSALRTETAADLTLAAEYDAWVNGPCPGCGDPDGLCDFGCDDPDCMSYDCESHDACEPEDVEDYLLRAHRFLTPITTLVAAEAYL